MFCPIPPGHPRGYHFFWGCPSLFITLILPCPALTNHFNPLILECPALFSLHFPVPLPFYHTHFSSDPGAARGDWAEQFDRRIIQKISVLNRPLQTLHNFKKLLFTSSDLAGNFGLSILNFAILFSFKNFH